MSPRKDHLFQGCDWCSYRSTIADAFDTLDQLHDLCLCHGWAEDAQGPDDRQEFLSELLSLSDDLSAQLAFADADSAPQGQSWPSPEQRWLGLEMRQTHHEMHQLLLQLLHGKTGHFAAPLIVLATKIKDYLKKMDQ